MSVCTCARARARQANEMRREQMQTSLDIVKSQLATTDATLLDHKKEVAEREETIKNARHELLTQVEKAITDSGVNFKEGRAQMVKSLAEYETACNKMSNGLDFMKEISDELMAASLPKETVAPVAHSPTATLLHAAPRYRIGQNVAPTYHIGQILHQSQLPGAISSPMGTHYTSPMGTVRPLGNVRRLVA